MRSRSHLYWLVLQRWPTKQLRILSLVLGQQFVKPQTHFQYPPLQSAILIVLLISFDSVGERDTEPNWHKRKENKWEAELLHYSLISASVSFLVSFYVNAAQASRKRGSEVSWGSRGHTCAKLDMTVWKFVASRAFKCGDVDWNWSDDSRKTLVNTI